MWRDDDKAPSNGRFQWTFEIEVWLAHSRLELILRFNKVNWLNYVPIMYCI